MPFCKYCGSAHDADAVFCTKCGKTISKKPTPPAKSIVEFSLVAEQEETFQIESGEQPYHHREGFFYCIKVKRNIDPACGFGNFLTETYLSLRRIEYAILSEFDGGEVTSVTSGVESPIKVFIGQFYGIEMNNFTVTVAKTALGITIQNLTLDNIKKSSMNSYIWKMMIQRTKFFI